jgi:beta-N-acetylhexosaminidase
MTKARRGLFTQKLLPVDEATRVLEAAEHRNISDEIAARALTLVKNERRVLPLDPLGHVVVASTEPRFLAEMGRGHPGVHGARLSSHPGRGGIARETKRLTTLVRSSGARAVVVGLMAEEWAPLVKALQRALPNVPVVAVSFASPYLLTSFPDVDGYLCAFGFRNESEIAAARALLGQAAPTGALPVDLPTGQAIGFGLRYDAATR